MHGSPIMFFFLFLHNLTRVHGVEVREWMGRATWILSLMPMRAPGRSSSYYMLAERTVGVAVEAIQWCMRMRRDTKRGEQPHTSDIRSHDGSAVHSKWHPLPMESIICGKLRFIGYEKLCIQGTGSKSVGICTVVTSIMMHLNAPLLLLRTTEYIAD